MCNKVYRGRYDTEKDDTLHDSILDSNKNVIFHITLC
jgi:hypothetical protein